MYETIEAEVEEFFKRRFPDKELEFEKKCGYFGEWVERFKTGHPERYMDKESTAIYAVMLEEKAKRLRQ